MKRKVAILFLASVLALVGVSILALRTQWAGRRLCDVLSARVEALSGLPLRVEACRVEPLRLAVEASGVRLGPADAPVLTAERLRARLSPVQALGRDLEVAELRVVRPRVALALPRPDPSRTAPCPPEALARLPVRRLEVEDGAVDISFEGGRVRVGRLDVAAAPVTTARSLRAPGLRRVGLRAALRDAELAAGGRVVRIDAGGAEGDLALDLSSLALEAWAEALGGRLDVRGTVERLCRPVLDLRAAARLPVRAALDLGGAPGVAGEGMLSAEVSLAGPASAPTVEGTARLREGRVLDMRPGDAEVRFRLAGDELRVDRAEVAMAGGSLVAQGTVRLGREVGLEAQARLEGTELGDVIGRFGLHPWISTRVRGEVTASGTAWPLRLAGRAALELADLRVLPHAWDRPGKPEPRILEFARGRIETEVRAGPEGVHLEGARLRVGAEELGASADLSFEVARGFEVRFAGGADLGELAHVGVVPVGGRAAVSGRVAAAPYGNPLVEAAATVRGLRFLQLDLGEASAEVRYGEGGGTALRARRIAGRRGETRYAGEVEVELGASPPRLAGSFEASGRLRDLLEAAMPAIPAARVARDALDAAAQVEARLRGLAAAPDAEFAVRLGPGELLGRPFDSGQASGRIEEGRRAVFDAAELRRGSGRARASGFAGLAAPFPWELETSAAGLALADLRLPGGRWEGTASGEAHLSGSAEEPALRFAASGDGVLASGVAVGSVQVGGSLKERALSVTGSAEGLGFSMQARAAGDWPFEARADLDVDDLTRFAPGGPPAGLRARARGFARARGLLADPLAAKAELELEELQVGYADFRVQNRGRAVLTADRGRLELRPLALTGTNTELALAGTRAADGRLAAGAEGSLDLRLLGGLVPAVARPQGRLALEAHVSGTWAEPLLVGSGRLRDAGFQIRDLPIVFAAMSGDLAFSQNRVIFDHLPAVVNGGRAELDGEVELVRLVPAKVRATARLDEVPLRIPAVLPSVISGQLAVAGTWDSMLLSGKLDVVRASYTERVELEKSLTEFRRRVTAPRSFDRSGEWLRFDVALALSGDIRVDNDLVRGSVRGELNLTGTLASLGLVGSLSMAPGGRATFRGNEFVLTHAVVDLTERRRVRVALDVHGEAQVRDFQVFMHLFGPLDDPQLQLTSVPSLSQEDVLTLLSLGVTSRDAALAAGGVGGAATAAAAQALFSASGLDEQLKRFLPRDGLVRDFTLRITSAYSEGAGQVVPKAEFESKVGDLLRLRYQAPLPGYAASTGGEARGQRAQAELLLDPVVRRLAGRPRARRGVERLEVRSSLQLQWDNDSPDVAANDFGADLRFRLEWNE